MEYDDYLALNYDGTVTDLGTSLRWQIGTGGSLPWSNAGEYCNALVLAGFSDWRLPTVQELLTLVTAETGKGGSYRDGVFYSNAFNDWSSEEVSSTEAYAVVFSHKDGAVEKDKNIDNSINSRCVRD